jgi:hypothetical protein
LFLFLLLPFSVIFEIFGEIKNTQIQKFHFWKIVQIDFFFNCSLSNFIFKFGKKMFKLKFVQIRICSNLNLFRFEFVQTQFCLDWICSNSILLRFEFIQTRFCSNSNLFTF